MDRIGRSSCADETDADRVRRTQVIVIYSGLSVLLCVGFGTLHVDLGSHVVALLMAGCAVAVVGLMVKLRWDKRLPSAAHGIMAVALVSTALISYHTGGMRLTNVCPYFILVVASVFLLGRAGLPWAVLALLVPAGFEVAAASGFVFPDHVPPHERAFDATVTWASAIVVVLVFVLAYEAARASAMRQLREAGCAKTQLLASMSHELRSPLQAILGVDELLGRGPLTAEQARQLAVGQRSAETLVALLDGLLDVASIERGRFSLRPADFDPVVVLEDVAEALRLSCEVSGLTLEVRIGDGTPRWVRGDPRRLRQILVNLGQNAIKYTTEGGVTLAVAPEGDRAQPSVCRFAVRDTGPGIPAGDRERIFESFTQLGASPGGAGLGLFICRQLTIEMGGRIDLESQVGVGTTFSIVLPFAPAAAPAAPDAEAPAAETAEAPEAGRLRVLVVDDVGVNRLAARHMLAKLCGAVSFAVDGQDAVSRWEAERPDLILMDVQMPVMDGLEATRRIRARERDAEAAPRVPIVAVTGGVTGDDEAAARAAGADSCLFKPYTYDDLRAVIRRYGEA